jgi:hypothetical protein
LLGWVGERVPPRLPVDTPPLPAVRSFDRPPRPRTVRGVGRSATGAGALSEPEASNSPMRRSIGRPAEGGRITDALYEEYGLQSIRIPGACRIRPSSSSRRRWPRLRRRNRAIGRTCRQRRVDGLLSDAQLESVIYAGEAHSGFSPAHGRSTTPSMSSPPRR